MEEIQTNSISSAVCTHMHMERDTSPTPPAPHADHNLHMPPLINHRIIVSAWIMNSPIWGADKGVVFLLSFGTVLGRHPKVRCKRNRFKQVCRDEMGGPYLAEWTHRDRGGYCRPSDPCGCSAGCAGTPKPQTAVEKCSGSGAPTDRGQALHTHNKKKVHNHHRHHHYQQQIHEAKLISIPGPKYRQ